MAKVPKTTTQQYNIPEDQDTRSAFGKAVFQWTENFYDVIHNRGANSWRFYNGDQWPKKRRPGLTQSTYNIIGPHIDIIAANLTDSQIVYELFPMTPVQDWESQVWTRLFEIATEQDRFTAVNSGLIKQSLIKGYCIGKVTHDESRNVPTRYEVVHPLNYMAEPGVKDPERDSSFHWHYVFLTPHEIKDMWPEKWGEMKRQFKEPDRTTSAGTTTEYDRERAGNKDYIYGAWIRELWLKTSDNDREPIPLEVTNEKLETERQELITGRKPLAIVDEDHAAHIDDHRVYEQEVLTNIANVQAQVQALQQTGQQGGQQGGQQPGQQRGQQINPQVIQQLMQQLIELQKRLTFTQAHIEEHEDIQAENIENKIDAATRRKYNGWRRIVYGGEEYTVLDDEETPYTDYEGRGIHPFVILQSDDTGNDIYGLSTVEKSTFAQKSINRWLSKFEDHLNCCSNPMLVVDVTRLAHDPSQIRSIAGQVISVEGRPDQALMWLHPPQISGQLIQDLFTWIRQIELLTGVSDVELGQFPRMERASAPFVQQLAFNGRARWRAHGRHYEDYLRRVGRKMHYIMQKYMTGEQQVMISDDPAKSQVINQTIMRGGRFETLNDMTVGRWDVRIQLKALLNQTEDAKMQVAIQLYQMKNALGMPILTPDGFAKMVNDPVLRESAREATQLWKAQQDAIQAQAQQAQQGGQQRGVRRA